MASDIRIFQIFYDRQSSSLILPEFTPLDNSKNLRPDWREFWPIKIFFEEHDLKEDTYYGFFSPKFSTKTGLKAKDVFEFIDKNSNASIISFSPFLDQSAFFFNVFEQGDINHKGLKAAAKLHLESFGMPFNLDTAITGHTGFIFSNYFVARAHVWKEWFRHAIFIFNAAESGQSDYGKLLIQKTTYLSQDIQMKVFFLERLINLIGYLHKDFSIASYPPWKLNLTPTKFSEFKEDVLISDLIKQKYIETSDNEYLQLFLDFRTRFIEKLSAAK
jgi:hypothetical protein